MDRWTRRWVGPWVLATAVGCSGGTGEEGAATGSGGAGTTGSGSAGTGMADAGMDAPSVEQWGPGDYPPGIDMMTYLDIDGVPGQPGPRQYKVHVPPGYDPATPAPLVFCLHGLMQTAVSFCVNGSGMVPKSDEAGFILVMPLGYNNSWNGGGCCGNAATMMLDDVGLMRAIFEEVATHVNVDRGRVYATGLSNGAYLSYRLACEAADLFVAVAPGAGAAPMVCNPSKQVSVLDIHGTQDTYVPYSWQAPALQTLAMANGCGATTQPAVVPQSGGDTTCVTHSGCPAGVEVTGCTIEGGGHVWFGDPSCGTGVGPTGCGFVGANSDTMINTQAAWEFFSRLSR
jgi:polyhydroxybutyrate depolymerase